MHTPGTASHASVVVILRQRMARLAGTQATCHTDTGQRFAAAHTHHAHAHSHAQTRKRTRRRYVAAAVGGRTSKLPTSGQRWLSESRGRA